MSPKDLAKIWHTVSNRLAVQFGIFSGNQPYEELPGSTQLLMEEVAEETLARIRVVEYANLGLPNEGDVIVVRYVNGMSDSDDRKKDYTAIRNYFADQGIHVRILGISGTMTLEKVSEDEMAIYGWVKK